MSAAPDEETELLGWLYGTQLFGVKLGLENTRRLLQELDLLESTASILHVAGTNGKGSTCAFAHSLLSAAGFQCGLFTSPHLVHFRERIRDSEREISSAELIAILKRLRETVSDWDTHPTFFELTLAAALMWFRDRGVDWIVLETGLGGRLDATNALQPAACILTSIGFDHMDVLGDTLAAIAAEKAGIIKAGVPVITGPQEAEALAVIRNTAKKVGAPFHHVSDPVSHIPLGIPGHHSAWNASLALKVLEVLGITLPNEARRTALAETRWPGRFQRWGTNGAIVLDGSHNPDAVNALIETWTSLYPDETAAIIYGGVAGKDHAVNLAQLEPIAAEWFLTPLKSPRALGTAQVRSMLPVTQSPVTECVGLDDAIQQALRSGKRVLVTGSLYLVGEALALLEDTMPFEPSAQ